MEVRGVWATRRVYVDGRFLSPALSAPGRGREPGFDWGSMNAGALDLAYSLLASVGTGRDACLYHRTFCRLFILRLPRADFVEELDLAEWLREARARAATVEDAPDPFA